MENWNYLVICIVNVWTCFLSDKEFLSQFIIVLFLLVKHIAKDRQKGVSVPLGIRHQSFYVLFHRLFDQLARTWHIVLFKTVNLASSP